MKSLSVENAETWAFWGRAVAVATVYALIADLSWLLLKLTPSLIIGITIVHWFVYQCRRIACGLANTQVDGYFAGYLDEMNRPFTRVRWAVSFLKQLALTGVAVWVISWLWTPRLPPPHEPLPDWFWNIIGGLGWGVASFFGFFHYWFKPSQAPRRGI